MDTRITFLLPMLLLTISAIFVFLIGMIQQHGFSSIEEDETENNNNNNPPGFKSIKKFDSNGKFITSWGSEGTGDGQFLHAHGIDIDSSGNVYVSDDDKNNIQKFTSDGKFITSWGSEGDGDGQFKKPEDIALDSLGNVYISDTRNSRIQVFAIVDTT